MVNSPSSQDVALVCTIIKIWYQDLVSKGLMYFSLNFSFTTFNSDSAAIHVLVIDLRLLVDSTAAVTLLLAALVTFLHTL